MSGDTRGPCGDLAGAIATEGRGMGTGGGGRACRVALEAEMAGDRPKHRSAAFMSEQPCLISGKRKEEWREERGRDDDSARRQQRRRLSIINRQIVGRPPSLERQLF